MAGEEDDGGGEEKKETASAPPRPTLTLPPRASPFGFPTDVSPGPMTLVSSLFSEYSDSTCASFSELLAGAMASPVASGIGRSTATAGGENTTNSSAGGGGGGGGGGSEDKERGRWEPPSPLFAMPPGFLDSPNFFSSAQVPYGISHQQALAQVTARAAWSHSHVNTQVDHPSVSAAPTASMVHPASSANTFQQMPTQTSERRSADDSSADTRSQSTSFTVDKPADDGFNWRKYGQKQVKGSEFPRSYYKCTHPNCPVKKKVERSLDGQVTEIIYKGQHNHEQPPTGRRAKDGDTLPNELNGNSDPIETGSHSQSGNFIRMAESCRRDRESGQTIQQVSGSSDDDELGDAEVGTNNRDEDMPDPKRRNVATGVTKSATLHKTVTEPRVIVQTQSEVDLLDDGYRWRKYGQKVVKGNPHPRSYYKCTYTGCTVRKHVERASTDAKAVITTYEGKHNHDVPAARNSSHNMANAGAAVNVIQPKALNPANNILLGRTEYRNSDQHPDAVLQLKEERDVT